MKTSWFDSEASVGPAGDLLDGASASSGPCARHESAKRRCRLADDLRDTLHSEGHLSDRYVTQRDDRVLPVKAASKRQFAASCTTQAVR